MDLNVTKMYLHHFLWSRYGLITGYLCLYMMTSEIGQLDFIGPDSRWYGFKATWVFVNDYLWSRSAGLYWSWFLGWGCGPHTGTFLYPSPLCCGSSGSRPSAWPLGCLVGPPLYWNTNHLSVQYQISNKIFLIFIACIDLKLPYTRITKILMQV